MKAPTQQQLNDPAWWDEFAGTASHYCRGKNQFYDFRLHHCPCCFARPTKSQAPEWDGEGLPPVGVECEVDINTLTISVVGTPDCWRWCEVLAHRDECAIVWIPSANFATKVCNRKAFRPIRTKAQRQREEVIAAAKRVISGPGGVNGLRDEDIENLNWLYDAGLLRGDS